MEEVSGMLLLLALSCFSVSQTLEVCDIDIERRNKYVSKFKSLGSSIYLLPCGSQDLQKPPRPAVGWVWTPLSSPW